MANTILSQNTPAGSDNRSDGDDRIRELKTALRSALDAGKHVPADLVVANDATTPNSKVTVAASGLIVSDGSAVAYMLDSVSVTADIAVAGVNGLDTGAEAAGTWYFIWVIYNATTTTIASLLSLSSAAPTMPTGYAYKRRVGAVLNDGSSNFLRFEQRGRVVLYTEAEIETRALNAGQAVAFTDVSLASFMPTTSRRAYLLAAADLVHNAAGVDFAVSLLQKGAPGTTDGVKAVWVRSQVNAVAVAASALAWIGTDASQVVQYKIATAPATSGGAHLYVAGYEDPV